MAAFSHGGPAALRPFLAVITFLLIVAALYLARIVVVPVVLSALLAFLLTPVVSGMQRWRVPRVAAAVVTALLTFSFLGGILGLMLFQFRDLAKDLTNNPDNRRRIQTKLDGLHRMLSGDEFQSLTRLIDETVQTLSPQPTSPGAADVATMGASTAGMLASPMGQGPLLAAAALAPDRSGAVQAVETSRTLATTVSPPSSFWGPVMEWAVAPAVEIFVDVGVIVILVVFMLAQHEDLRDRMIRLSGTRNVTSTTKALSDAARRVRRYLLMQFFVNLSFGVIVALGLWLIGVPYPWLWGVFGALLRYIPYIGTWLGAACPVLLSIALSDGWAQPLETLGLFALLDLGITNALEPILYGRSIGVSGTALLVAAVFWTWMWGPIGLILSTPLTACIVVLGRNVAHLDCLSIVLGDQPALSPALSFYQRLVARDEDEASVLVETFLQKNGVEKVYDDLLAPALIHSKQGRNDGSMTAEDEAFIQEAMGRLLEDVVFPEQDQIDAREMEKDGDAMKCELFVLGCPAKDAQDALALRMLQRLLPAGKCQMEVLSTETLAGAVLTRVEQTHPAVVVIGAVPPYSFSSIRYLCKRLRAHSPDVKIVVGCWGLREGVKATVERLQSAGADLISAELLESRGQLLPMIQEAAVRRAAPQMETAST
jgi:predicted PurR-regulated permease PerM